MPDNGLLMAALGIQGVMMYGVIQNIKAVKEGMEGVSASSVGGKRAATLPTSTP